MKGIILAGGAGSRLNPITNVVSKQLLPIFDKPMIYYPLSILMLLGIKEILIISTSEDTPRFQELLGDGSNIGLKLSYKVQKKPNGLAEAFIIGEKFINRDDVALILGDNLFYGSGYLDKIRNSIKKLKGSLIFGYEVDDPHRYGVVEFDSNRNVISLEEKPKNPKTNYAIPGLYFYDNNVVQYAKKIKPSKRGELEITDLNKIYLKNGNLSVHLLGRGVVWFDTGTFLSMLDASNFILSIEKRQGLKVACIEEIAFKMGYISKKELANIANPIKNSEYGKYLINLLNKL
tara:strand:- start:1037 stop:1906 length:870 start_codon:yes stop_codon:yes gene_type:complete